MFRRLTRWMIHGNTAGKHHANRGRHSSGERRSFLSLFTESDSPYNSHRLSNGGITVYMILSQLRAERMGSQAAA